MTRRRIAQCVVASANGVCTARGRFSRNRVEYCRCADRVHNHVQGLWPRQECGLWFAAIMLPLRGSFLAAAPALLCGFS